MIALITGDKQRFEVPLDLALASKTIADVLEEVEPGVITGAETSNEPVPLPNVSGPVLAKIIAFWNQAHAVDSQQSVEEFAKSMEIADIWDLINAANYLNMQPLLQGLCGYVAALMKGKSPQELRDILGIVNDFTPEEEARILKENAWAFATP